LPCPQVFQLKKKSNNLWYVCAGSGGVWKTTNVGTTWTPVFDGQKVYSIGCVTDIIIDPRNPDVLYALMTLLLLISKV